MPNDTPNASAGASGDVPETHSNLAEMLDATEKAFRSKVEALEAALLNLTTVDMPQQIANSIKALSEELKAALLAHLELKLQAMAGAIETGAGRAFVGVTIDTPATPKGKFIGLVVKQHDAETVDAVVFLDGKAEGIPHWPSTCYAKGLKLAGSEGAGEVNVWSKIL